ncbi:MAG: hypothetical protein U5K76_01285 [Woeseiaceae bacterium]|nr:hypothetical protein [Woeseiaceae bacterium]
MQRSLDYYETQYDLPPISNLVLGPGTGFEALRAGIAEQLGLAVRTLDLDELFDLEMPLAPDEQRECLFAVGAALRPDSAATWEAS